MFNKIFYKILLFNVCIIVAMTVMFFALSNHASKSMFSNALNGIDIEVMDELSMALAGFYREHQSWEPLVTNKPMWEGVVNQQFFTTFFALMKKAKARLGNQPVGDVAPLGPPSTTGAPPKWDMPFGTFLQRLSLLNDQQIRLIAPEISNKDVYMKAIKLDGQVIGWLEVGKINVDILPLADYFFDQQVVISTWASVFGAFVAVVLSFIFSLHITAPIKSLTLAAKKISDRDYKSIVEVKTHDEFHVLAQSFNAISQELQSYSDRQKQWIMDISHELRTPIAILISEISAICDEITTCDIAAVAELQQEVLQIKRLVDDLHDLSSVQTVGFNFQKHTFNLQALMASQIKHYSGRFTQRGIELISTTVKNPILIEGDENRIAQVIRNLLENCLRYTQSPGTVWMRVEPIKGMAKLILEDSGPGVASEDLPKLFDRLYRTEPSRNRLTGGAGLGLSICKEIIAAHSGEIRAMAGDNGGLRIEVMLELADGVKE